MSRQMNERETIWKDEAPPSTAMRNKKNIKRKKKLNTPKPSVFALFSEAREGRSVRFVPHSLQLVSLLLSSVCPQCKMLPSLQKSCSPLPAQLIDMALSMLGAATQRCREWSWNTPLAGKERKAQLKLHLLALLPLLSKERGRRGERERDREGVDVKVGPSIGFQIR